MGAWAPGHYRMGQLEPLPTLGHCLVGRDVGRNAPRSGLQVYPSTAGHCYRTSTDCSGVFLYLGAPSRVGTSSALASLGVPVFLGFCLAFLSMWTCPRAGEVRGQATSHGPQNMQCHLSPLHRRTRSGGHVTDCEAGPKVPPLSSGEVSEVQRLISTEDRQPNMGPTTSQGQERTGRSRTA